MQAQELLARRKADPLHADQLEFVQRIKALGLAGDWRTIMTEMNAAKQGEHFMDQGQLLSHTALSCLREATQDSCAFLHNRLHAELCEAAFEALCHCNRSGEASLLLQELKHRGFRVTLQHFSRIMAVCARLGQADRARQVSQFVTCLLYTISRYCVRSPFIS